MTSHERLAFWENPRDNWKRAASILKLACADWPPPRARELAQSLRGGGWDAAHIQRGIMRVLLPELSI